MKKVFVLAVLAAGVVSSASAYEGRLLRFPATNGSEVVFSYAGDLYSVPIEGGNARHLTTHEGYEMFARFSPDGKQIAFTGQYDGSTEVYVMPAEGGKPERLTFTATNERDNLADRMGPNNVVMCWSRDGKSIVYRNRISSGFEGKLFTVSPQGGMSTPIPLPEGGFCSYSPDGKKLAYNRVFREFRTWKYYKGGMADDIWIYDAEAASVVNVTNNVAQDVFPMWIGDEIFFASDRDNRMNLFCYNTKTGSTEKVTDFADYDVKFPSTDGKIIVFENGGYIYKFNPATRKSERIHIEMSDEGNGARPEIRSVGASMRYWSIAPDGNRFLIGARGEIFNVPSEHGVTRNISRTSGAHERQPEWSADGKSVFYIGDATGETELWMRPAEGGVATQLTSGTDTYIDFFELSPDGKTIIYGDRKNRLFKLDVATKTKVKIAEEPLSRFYGVKFSPDSRWITYTRPAKNNMGVVYIYNLTDGKEYAVTDDWYDSSAPAFSSDGKYLIFASARDFNPIYSNTEWNHAYTNMEGVYVAMLSATTPSPFIVKDDVVKVDTPKAENEKADKKSGKKQSGKGADAAKSDKTASVTKIDVEGLADRIVKLPLRSGNYGNFYCDGKKLWLRNGGETMVFTFDTRKCESFGRGQLTVSANGKKASFKSGNKVYVMDFPASKLSTEKILDLSNVKATIDYPEEWAQIFDEAWRAYRDGFYLENMHGVDWNAMKEKYAALLPFVKCRQDLSYVIGGLIGELACGHAYVDPGDFKGVDIVKTGMLGAELSADKSGFFRIDKILKGASYSPSLFSPLTEIGLNVKEGDFIVAVDGVLSNSVKNIYSLLEGKAGVPTELAVNSEPKAEGARKIVVTPIADEYPLYHYAWVQKNIETVERATGGRVGYIYVPDMGPEGLNEFCRYYYPQLDKEALIIDDRGNGGGNVSPMLLERLMRKPYRMTMYRGSSRNEIIPEGTAYGPKVLLVSKYSASDGDLFPWSFKAVKLGKVIGTRTWGGIVGITRSLPYIDGTDVRVPFFTNYDAATGKWIVENHGVDPDILIDNDPIKEAAGIDEQLNKAIEVILEELKDYKPLPSTPEPRLLKDLGVK